MSLQVKILSSLFYAAQQGKLQKAIDLGAKLQNKTSFIEGSLTESLSNFCKQNIPLLNLKMKSFERINRASIAFNQIHSAQLKGIDSKLLAII